MKTVAGIPVFEVEFDRDGELFRASQADELVAGLAGPPPVTDLFVFAHGWNNDMADARALYEAFFAQVGAILDGAPPAGIAGRRFAGAVTLWPSKKFTDKELIPGGGAAAIGSEELSVVRSLLKDFAKEPTRLGKSSPASAAQQKKVARATELLKGIETNPKAQVQFVRTIRSLLSEKAAHADDASKDFFKIEDETLLANLRESAVVAGPRGGTGGAAGLGFGGPGLGGGGAAASLSDIGESVSAGLRRLLNFATYYRMKERAGIVGSKGVADLLRKVRKKAPSLRLHLVGHSFGGRVITAAADASGPANKVDTLTLLQAAYSHNGLAQKFDGKNDGFFRKVISGSKVTGPILATCTKNDRAVGIAYPLASRVARQNAASAAALGDANDPYGGIGRNGAVKTPEAVEGTLLAKSSAYAFSAGKVFNLNADAVIGDHSDICKPEVAWALLCAVAKTA